MSWGEVKKINSDLSKPLDTLITEKADEVKTAIASQTSVNTVTTAIGATNATGGTASAGGIFAKLNKLLTDWTTARAGKIDNIDTNISALVAGKVVKSVQRGITTSTAESTLTIPISTINPAKSMAIVSGLLGSNINSVAFLQSLTSNSIVITSATAVTSGHKICWQVIEFY